MAAATVSSVSHSELRHAGQGLFDQPECSCFAAVGKIGGTEGEDVAAAEEQAFGHCEDGHSAAAHEFFLEGIDRAPCQQLVQHAHRLSVVGIRRQGEGHRRHLHRRQVFREGNFATKLPAVHVRDVRRWCPARRDNAEGLPHLGHRSGCIHGPDDHQVGIAGAIEGLVEAPSAGQGGAFDVLLGAGRADGIGVTSQHRSLHAGAHPRQGVVLDPEAQFLGDDALLVGEVFLGEVEVRHAVRFHDKQLAQPRRRERRDIDRLVEGRIAVPRPAALGVVAHQLVLGKVRAAAEHQVLEQVREASAVLFLVGGTDVIPNLRRHHWHVGVGEDGDG